MMELTGDSRVIKYENEDICDKITKYIQENDYSATPIVDVVEIDNVKENEFSVSPFVGVELDSVKNVEFTTCNTDFDDDELDDILKEQMALKRIKYIRDYRKSLINFSDPEMDKIDHYIKPKLDGNNQLKNKIDVSKFSNSNEVGDCDSIVDDNLLECITVPDTRQSLKNQSSVENIRKLSKALYHNVEMQLELTKIESVLEERLKQNKKDQIFVRSEISKLKQEERNNVKKNQRKVSWYAPFGRPYFKNEKKYSCPKNQDAVLMNLNNQILSINLFRSRPWKLKEKYYLEEGVRKILLKEHTNKLYEKEEEFKSQLKNDTACDNKKKKNIKIELQCISNKIELLEKKTLAELFSTCEPDREFDWLKIAVKDVPQHSSEECQRMWHLYVKPSVNKKRFTKNEDHKILRLVETHGEQNWDIIAKKLGTSRTEFLCFFNYQRRLVKGSNKCGKWTKEEDDKLVKIIQEHRVGEFIPWPKIAYYFEGRTLPQLYARWSYSLNPHVRKGRFTQIEDKLIISYVRKYGENFGKISKLLGYRTSIQLRHRYSIKKMVNLNNVGRWSLEEDELLLSLVDKYGVSCWSEISKQFITRNRTQIRQRFGAIKNFMRENPGKGITDISRGPKAQSQFLIPVGPREIKAAETQENKLLSELVEENKIKKKLIKQRDIALTRMKRGRKKICKRNNIDTKLIDYFKEIFSIDKLKLRTHCVKPDIDKAARAMMILCCFLRSSLILSGNEFDKAIKNLPFTLRKVVCRMTEDERGCENFRAELFNHTVNSESCTTNKIQSINSHALFIDYLPIDPKETLVSNSYNLLSGLTRDNQFYERKYLNNMSYFLPPNIITMIGCRSMILIKGKILSSLNLKSKRFDYLFPNDSRLLRQNNLKYFCGYFSEDEDESDDDSVAQIDETDEVVKNYSKKSSSSSFDFPPSNYGVNVSASLTISNHRVDLSNSYTPSNHGVDVSDSYNSSNHGDVLDSYTPSNHGVDVSDCYTPSIHGVDVLDSYTPSNHGVDVSDSYTPIHGVDVLDSYTPSNHGVVVSDCCTPSIRGVDVSVSSTSSLVPCTGLKSPLISSFLSATDDIDISFPSTSGICDSFQPTLFSETPLLFELDNECNASDLQKDEIQKVKTKRLTKEEAIELWKERLMVIFGWSLILANNPPIISNIENEDSDKELKQLKKSLKNNTKGISDLQVSHKGERINKEKIQENNWSGSYNFKKIEKLNKRRIQDSENCKVLKDIKDKAKEKMCTAKQEKPSSSISDQPITSTDADSKVRPAKRQYIKCKSMSSNSENAGVFSEILGEEKNLSGKLGERAFITEELFLDDQNYLRPKRLKKTNKLLEDYEIY